MPLAALLMICVVVALRVLCTMSLPSGDQMPKCAKPATPATGKVTREATPLDTSTIESSVPLDTVCSETSRFLASNDKAGLRYGFPEPSVPSGRPFLSNHSNSRGSGLPFQYAIVPFVAIE